MKPNISKTRRRKGKRTIGQPSQPFDLAPYNGKMPVVIRVLDHALAFQGWSRSARIRLLKAISSGEATKPISEVLGLPEDASAPSAPQ